MAISQIKKYKIIKDENGNKIQVQKTKEEWNRETKNGTATWYFYSRYKINDQTKQYKSGVFVYKRNAEEEETLFKVNPLEYIKTRSKRAKIDLRECDISKSKILNDYFLDYCDYIKDYIKESSLYEYKGIWKNHFSDNLGILTPQQINLEIIQNWCEKANKETRTINDIEQKYSIKSKNKWLSTLSNFFDYLKSKGLIEINYAKVVGTFKNPNANKNKKKKIKYQTLEEFQLFMSEIDENDFWYAFFNFAFWHGCRIGEQRALKIKDVDFNNDIIHFHQTFTKNNSGGEKIGSIKNNKERYISLSPHSKKYLIKLINFYKEMDGYSEEWFLFGGAYNTYKNRITRAFNKYYTDLKNKHPNLNINILTHHEFGRHSHASYLLNKGIESGIARELVYEMIAERLGDTIDVIKETYAHPYETKYNEKIKELLK